MGRESVGNAAAGTLPGRTASPTSGAAVVEKAEERGRKTEFVDVEIRSRDGLGDARNFQGRWRMMMTMKMMRLKTTHCNPFSNHYRSCFYQLFFFFLAVVDSISLRTDALNFLFDGSAVVFAADDTHVDADQILGAPRFAENRAVLLQVVTFARHKRNALLAVG